MIQEAGRKRRDAASPRSSSFSSSALGCGTWPPPAPAAISHLKGGGGRSDGSRMEELTSCWKPLTELDPSEAHTHSCSDSPGSWRLTDSTMTHVALEVKQVRKKKTTPHFSFPWLPVKHDSHLRWTSQSVSNLFSKKCWLHGCKISPWINTMRFIVGGKKREMSPQVSGYQTYSRLLSDGQQRNTEIVHAGAVSLILKKHQIKKRCFRSEVLISACPEQKVTK